MVAILVGLIFAFALNANAQSAAPAPTSGQSQAQPQSPSAPAQTPSQPPAETSIQSSPGASSQGSAGAQIAAEPAPELSTHESPPPIRVPVNLVLVRVVVRDATGKPVGNLKKEDFQLFDQRKPQIITHFSIDTPVTAAPKAAAPGTGENAEGTSAAAETFVRPSRFVAFLFDDVHSVLGDLMQARNGADRYIKTSMLPADRIAIYTISGQGQVDFTDDRAKLQAALMGLMLHPVGAGSQNGETECPPMNYYEADQIATQEDPQALAIATADALVCAFNNDPRMTAAASAMANATAYQVVAAGEQQTVYSFRRLEEVLKRMNALPGQRSIVLISPGFLTMRYGSELDDIISHAARGSVLINTLDLRGLYTPDFAQDISTGNTGSVAMTGYRAKFRLEEQSIESDVLEELADGTGASYFHNSNDLDAGFRQAALAPAYSYVLGFSPANLKLDGKFHPLKVTLTTKESYTLQARRGYFAPKRTSDPSQLAKQEVEEEVFSQEELHDLPAELKTQFYKVDATDAKLAVLTHVDIGRLRFRKEDGRNRNDLTIVAALFDRNGNYITGSEKILEIRLRDTTLAKLEQTGVTLKANFDVKPGDYVVRMVVRDSEAAQLTAVNGMVQIPY
ncbi:MAG: VWA domain-containing protein [Candidatus Acidiferrales bacterium]